MWFFHGSAVASHIPDGSKKRLTPKIQSAKVGDLFDNIKWISVGFVTINSKFIFA